MSSTRKIYAMPGQARHDIDPVYGAACTARAVPHSPDRHPGQEPGSRTGLRFSCVLLFTLLGCALFAQRSPFNNLEVLPADSTGHYRILIGGHFHGESTNRSGYPAATLLANLDTINALGASIFLSTGDLFMDPEKDAQRYQRSLFSKVRTPLFNAPGNHDLVRGKAEGGDLNLMRCPVGMLTIDTERSSGSMSSDDLDRLRSIPACIRRVFIISHRPIWSEDDPQYSDLFKDNTRSLTGTNFRKDVYPILEKIAQHAHVYWISGSLGGSAPSSIFFQQHAPNITFIQCAIRDEPRDALLIADVYPDTVKWSALSLTGQKLLAPEAYNAAWWRERVGRKEPFNWRLLPYLVKTTVLRREFWWGVLAAALLLWTGRRLYRRWG